MNYGTIHILYLGKYSLRRECKHITVNRLISFTNFNAQFFSFINSMYVTLQSSKHVEDCNVTYILLMNEKNCALKLVNEISL